MIKENLRYEIWEKYYSVMSCAKYYEVLAGKYKRYSNMLRFLWLVPMFSGITLMIGLIPSYSSIVFTLIGGAVAALIAFDFVFDITGKSIRLSQTSKNCSRLVDDWAKLWIDANSEDLDELGIRERHYALVARFTNATIDVDDDIISKNEKLNEECEKIVIKYLEGKYHYA